MPSERTPLLVDEGDDIDSPSSGVTATLLFAVAIASLSSFHFGYTLGFTSPTLGAMQQLLNETKGMDTTLEAANVASITCIGALIGALFFAGQIAERFGRRAALAFPLIPGGTGWLLIIFSVNVPKSAYSMLMAGRFFTGVAIGIQSFAVPLFVNEIAPPEIRGGLGTVNQILIVTGVIVAYAAGGAFQAQGIAGMRLTAVLALVPLVIGSVAMAAIAESPRWLCAQSRDEDAAKALGWFRLKSSSHVAVEIEAVAEAVRSGGEQASFVDLFRPALRKQTIAAGGLQCMVQLSGINSFIFFAQSIFEDAGLADPARNAILTQVVQLGATLFMAFVLVDRFGRKTLYCLSSLICALAAGGMSAFYFISGDCPGRASNGTNSSNFTNGPFNNLQYYSTEVVCHSAPSSLALGSLFLFMAGFALGMGALPWVIMGEVVPLRARGTATSFATAMMWVTSYIVTETFTPLEAALGPGGIFALYAVLCFLNGVFVRIAVPETKGKTLEEIESEMNSSKHEKSVNTPTR